MAPCDQLAVSMEYVDQVIASFQLASKARPGCRPPTSTTPEAVVSIAHAYIGAMPLVIGPKDLPAGANACHMAGAAPGRMKERRLPSASSVPYSSLM